MTAPVFLQYLSILWYIYPDKYHITKLLSLTFIHHKRVKGEHFLLDAALDAVTLYRFFSKGLQPKRILV